MSSTVTDWKNWVNSHGGINGHPVQATYDNDNSDPAQATSEATSLISSGVVAIMSQSTPESAFAATATAAHVPVIGLAISSDDFAQLDQPDYFPTGMTVDTTVAGQMLVPKQLGYDTWGEAYCSGSAVTAQAAAGKPALGKALGVQVVAEVPTLCPSPNYTAQCLIAKKDGAQAFFPAGPPVALVDDCVAQGYSPHWLYSTDFTTNLLSDKNLKDAVGNVGVISWLATGTPALTEFDQATKGLAEHAVTPEVVIGSWVGLKAFQTAATAAISASATPTASAVLTGLYGFHNQTLGGLTQPLNYVQGKSTRNGCEYVVGIKNGQFDAPLGYNYSCLTQAQMKCN